MNKLFCAFFACAWGLVSTAYGQQEVSVDQFTGTANVTIPLTAASIGGVAMPVSLGYTATGLQADDKGGLVGAGWSLVGIPRLSREVRGLPDDAKPRSSSEADARYGWLTAEAQQKTTSIAAFAGFSAPYIPATTASALETAAATLSAGFETRSSTSGGVVTTMYDSEPDIYSYSVPGHAGKFVFDTQGNVRTIPYDPIEITRGYATLNTVAFDSLGYSIAAFTLRTPEGITYTFNQPDVMRRQTVDNPAFTPTQEMYFGRDYYYYKRPGQGGLKYPVAWNIAQAVNLSGEQLTFGYTNFFGDYSIALKRTAFRVAHAGNNQEKEYLWLLRGNQRLLTSITTPTATVSFTLANNTTVFDNFLTGVEVTSSLLAASGVSRSIRFKYYTARSAPLANGTDWLNHYAEPISVVSSLGEFMGPTRRFLQSVSSSTACTRPLTYSFRYHHIDPTALTTDLPPPGTGHRDFWGNLRYDPDDANVGMQVLLYGYPTDCSPQLVPGGPFRLFPLGNTAAIAVSGGDDYRPASDNTPPTPSGESAFQASTLLGTLTEVKLPTGGRIQLEYEAHRFFDTKANSATYASGGLYIGPGPRIKTIKWLDPVSNKTQQRDFSYVNPTTNITSGRLLNWPVYGFLDPFDGGGPLNESAVSSADALASDPFEGRTVGYEYVTERRVFPGRSGRGRTVTRFTIPGTADDLSATLTDGPVWHRTVVGLGRTNNASGTGSYLNGNYVPGYGGYPLALNTNLDHWRGLPVRIEEWNEPTGGSTTGVLARSTDYQYKFWQKPMATGSSLLPVQGWAYEWIRYTPAPLASCARYDLLTDFRVVVVQKTQTLTDQAVASRNQITNAYYRYNDDGYLACTALRASDGSGRRTTYKYLKDYQLPPPLATLPTSPAPTDLQVLAYRCYHENLTSEPIETIEEFIPAGTTTIQLQRASLKTFIATPAGSTGVRTRLHKALEWRRNTPISRIGYDSTAVTGTGSAAQWHIGSLYQPAQPEAVIEEVDSRRLASASVSNRTGRTIQGTHWGYNGYLPTLQIANAYASEVRFSNFESTIPADLLYAWSTSPTASTSAKRTGEYGATLTSSTSLQTLLPAPAAGVMASPDAEACRLVVWVRGSAGTSLRVQLAYNTNPPVFNKDFPIATTGVWQRIETILATGIPPVDRHNYQLSLTTTGGNLDVDDALVMPVNATAQSVTYDPTQGMSSETDERGKTAFYQYNGAGQLRTIRDQQQNILRQNTRVIAGWEEDVTPQVSFSVGGTLREGQVVQFNAPTSLCGAAITSYQWDFGCSSGCTTTGNTTATPTCTYPITSPAGFGPGQSYTVTLTVTTSSGGSYTTSQIVALLRVIPPPIAYNVCINGPVTYYRCGGTVGPIASCLPAASAAQYSTVFAVTPPATAQACQPYTYLWGVDLHLADNTWRRYSDVRTEPPFNNPRVNRSTATTSRLEVGNPTVNNPNYTTILNNPQSYYYCLITDACGQRYLVADGRFLITVLQDGACP